MIDHSRDLAETWRRRGTAAEQQDEDAVDVRIVQSHGKAHKPRLQCFLTAAFSSRHRLTGGEGMGCVAARGPAEA
jgi:hypothetical protein